MQPPKPTDSQDTVKGSNPGNVTLSWRSVAYVSILIALGSTGTLIVITATGNDDVLSTVALALAIVAFVIQILVFVAQVFASNQQLARNEEVYARLHGLLEGLKGTTQGTQDVMNTWAGQLIQAATSTASKTLVNTEDDKFDPEVFQTQLIEEVKKIAQGREHDPDDDGSRDLLPQPVPNPFDHYGSIATSRPWRFSYGSGESSAEDEVILDQLETFPDEEEGRSSYEILQTLPPLALIQLKRYADDELRSRKNGNYVGLWRAASTPTTDLLVSKDLVQQTDRTDNEGRHLMVLTPLGRQVARLVVARGGKPDWYRELESQSFGIEP